MTQLQRKIFLTARWENLVMVNYQVQPELLQPFLPRFTELDTFEGKHLISLVGFMFRDTKVFGVKWPWHTHFEEVNLRFYVKHFDGQKWKRGVVFISEIVPSPIIAIMANKLYHEAYKAMPMKHGMELRQGLLSLNYGWKYRNNWNTLEVSASASLNSIIKGSEEEFIFEHYWGYNRYDAATTVEYGVEHDVWQVQKITNWRVNCDFAGLYGAQFKHLASAEPSSVLMAKGSPVIIRKPVFLRS
ncbi:DUF2071 domain-containing protein [Segetibacter sp. 3557_3]|uniref:YqjF family protein n=1 Tax=Segetibacter sp. 3557_3 TaxID=2547429 RepID=UPI001058F3C2|nr:DUF2071 domain-containing protein [Segetibacter sp. 3557_3]TDH28947.1 DUF2071 domain-containing protein [Segetibacter sp. 3557_3]